MNIRQTAFLYFILSSVIFTAAAPPAWGRTFTSIKGQSLEGEITAKTADNVTIRRASDGKEFTLPLKSFSQADQAEIAKWSPSAIPAPAPSGGKPGAPAGNSSAQILGKISFSASKDKLSDEKIAKSGGSKLVDAKSQTWCWKIVIKNGSREPISGLSLKYRQVVERTDRNQGSRSGAAKRVARRQSGGLVVPDIPPFGSVTVMTDGIAVEEMKSAAASHSTNSSGERVTKVTTYKWDEALSGLGLELFQGQTKVTDWKTGTDPGQEPRP